MIQDNVDDVHDGHLAKPVDVDTVQPAEVEPAGDGDASTDADAGVGEGAAVAGGGGAESPAPAPATTVSPVSHQANRHVAHVAGAVDVDPIQPAEVEPAGDASNDADTSVGNGAAVAVCWWC